MVTKGRILIYFDDLVMALTKSYGKTMDTHIYSPRDILSSIQGLHPVDAEAVVHGYWIDSTSVDHMGRIIEHSIDCSVCDSVFKDDSRAVVKHWKERFEVCPFCGAKMDAYKLSPTADNLSANGGDRNDY